MNLPARLLITLFLIFSPFAAQGAPQVGDPAPDFTLVGSDGKQHSLSDYRGEKYVVIAFFPKAFTGG